MSWTWTALQTNALLTFLKNPLAPPAPAATEPKWSDEPSYVVHFGLSVAQAAMLAADV